MDRARRATFILLCVFALSLPGCVRGPGFGKAEPDRPQKEIKHPAATEEMERPAATQPKPAKKPQPPAEPAATETKSPEEPSDPPPPMKPPAIGGSGG